MEMKNTEREFSAGGAILNREKTLLIFVQNLKGQKVWTFPKGHIEQGETPEDAALREVWEETGYKCRILKKLFSAKYMFTRNLRLVKKEVTWFLMEKTGGSGTPITKNEIIDLKWLTIDEAERLIRYPSDFEMIKLLRKEINPRQNP